MGLRIFVNTTPGFANLSNLFFSSLWCLWLTKTSFTGVYVTGKSRRKKLKDTDQKDPTQTSPQEVVVKQDEQQDPAAIVSALQVLFVQYYITQYTLQFTIKCKVYWVI